MAWTLANNSFETPTLTSGSYDGAPSGFTWNYSVNGFAVTYNSLYDGAGTTQPNGNQCIFFYDNGSVDQTVAGVPAGTYTISLWAKQSPALGAFPGSILVIVDGVTVSTIAPPDIVWVSYTTPTFTVAAGSRNIKLLGVDTSGGHISCIDLVTVNLISLAGMLFRQPGLSLGGAGRFAQPGVNS